MNDIQGRIEMLPFDSEAEKLAEVSINPADKINKQMDQKRRGFGEN